MRWGWPIVLLLMAVTAAVFLFKPITSIPAMTPKDFNEGYHAYFAAVAFDPAHLYPGQTSLIENVYTPLHYYLVGLVGAGLGDHIVAGRWVALLAFAVTSALIAATVRRVSGSGRTAVFSALLFASFIALRHPSYVGMNDPQWVGQAFAAAGLYAFIRWGATRAGLLSVAVLVLAAGMAKQTLIALPLAITWCLSVHDRRKALDWLLYSALVLAASVGALYAVYGKQFLVGVLWLESDSQISWLRVVNNFRTLLEPMAVLLGGLVVFVALEPRGRVKSLVLAYAVAAALVGFLITGAAGLDWNHLYDLVVALVVATGLAVHRLGERLAAIWVPRAVEALAAFFIAVGVFVAVPSKLAEARWTAHELAQREMRAKRDIAYISEQKGPVLCETIALCYWGKKPFDADILVIRRKLSTGALPYEEFRSLIDSGYFDALQFHSGGSTGRTKRLPEAANDYILQKYQSRPNEMGGSFLTPRGSQ